MPSDKKFKRLNWEPMEPLINELAAKAADYIDIANAPVIETSNKFADRLWCRLPAEYNLAVCKRVMKLAVVKHLCGEEFHWEHKA